MKSLNVLLALLVTASFALYTGCHDTPPSGPAASLGNNTVAKYVAIGNSLTAGYQSNALYASAQQYSFTNLIAHQLKQAGAKFPEDFQQPLYGDPGNEDPVTGKAARYEIISLLGPVVGPRGLNAGSPTNTALPRPYDNLAVPGAVIFDLLDTTNVATKRQPPPQRNNPFFQLVMRDQTAFGRTLLAQAARLKPDLVTFWLGNNDVLGFATSGGFSPSSPTPTATFTALYTQALGALRDSLPNAKIVTANIPDVRSIPFFNTLGPKIAGLLPAGIYLRYQKHGVTGPSFDSTRFTESNPPLICLTGSSYAAYLGKTGGQGAGQWYKDKRYPALPPGIDTTLPFGFHPQNPWPDALALDASEQTTAGNAVAAFNSTIASVASSKSVALVDMNTFFNNAKANGYFASGYKLTADYITGGLFSLDGVHPSSRGAGVVANEFIKVMNSTWRMSVPFVDVAQLPSIPAPLGKTVDGNGIPIIPSEAFRGLDMLWGAGR